MINEVVISALESLNVPVTFQKYTGTAFPHITFFEYNQLGEGFSDDYETVTGHYVQVDIWSKSDYSQLVSAVKTSMAEVGFIRRSEADIYEDDTKIYHKGMRFYYQEEV